MMCWPTRQLCAPRQLDVSTSQRPCHARNPPTPASRPPAPPLPPPPAFFAVTSPCPPPPRLALSFFPPSSPAKVKEMGTCSARGSLSLSWPAQSAAQVCCCWQPSSVETAFRLTASCMRISERPGDQAPSGFHMHTIQYLSVTVGVW